MIRRLKHHQIDFAKYDACLKESVQYKYSATSAFLDITSSQQWELLVYQDYKAVMPVPLIWKIGVKLVVNPKLCQQLGVFSQEDSPRLNELFLHYLQANYAVWYYAFNDANQFVTPLKTRKNHLLAPQPYEKARQAYSPKRKRKLRQDAEVTANSEIQEVDFTQAKGFILDHYQIGEGNEIQGFISIFQRFFEAEKLKFQAFFYHGKIINLLALYYDEKTVALLGTFNNKKYVKLSGASVLIDREIAKNIDTRIFDFEGGELPNVEEFFRGFRPEVKPYPFIEFSRKEVMAQLASLFLRGKSVF